MVAFLLFAVPVHATAPIQPLVYPETDLKLPQAGLSYTNGEIALLASQIALKHGLNAATFVAVVKCESGFNQHARGDYLNGAPTSFGPAQFHRPVRDWGITIEQADDPVFALNLMAKVWLKGEASRWTCFSIVNRDT